MDGTQTCDSGRSASRAPGGREGSASRNGATETLRVQWRLAARDGCTRRWQREAPGGRAESTRR